MKYVKVMMRLFLVALFGVSMTSCAVLGALGGSGNAQIFLTSPQVGSTVTITSNNQKITLKGSVTSDVDIDTVTINPNGLGITPANFFAGKWDVDLSVTPNDYTIEVTAKDVNGSESKETFSFTVVLDTNAAGSSSSSVSSDNSSSAFSSSFSSTFSSSLSSSFSSTFSSNSSSAFSSSFSSTFSSSLSSSFSSTFSSSLSSSFSSTSSSNSSSATSSSTSSVAPYVNLNITTPVNGTLTNVYTVTLSGTTGVDTAHSVTKVEVKLNAGSWVSAIGTDNWTEQLTLAPGTNNIHARAIANNGRTNTHSWTLVLEKIAQIASGGYQNFVVTKSGHLYVTGWNNYGQLGVGDTDYKDSWTKSLTAVAGIAGGLYHSVALKTNGTIWGTGWNTNGQLGLNDQMNRNSWTPATNVGTFGFSQVSAGNSHSFVLKDNALLATGWNYYGQLCTGDQMDKYKWAIVRYGVSKISAGYNYSLLIMNDTTLWGVGVDFEGQLGLSVNGGVAYQLTNSLSNVADIATGSFHSLALKNDETVWATGENDRGQLGTGNTNNVTNWTQVLSGVSKIACGAYHSLALKTDGTLWVTGGNEHGQLGTGNGIDVSTWTQVLSGVSDIAGGWDSSMALKNDGTLWITGGNEHGQLGTGNTMGTSTWTRVW